MQPKEIGSAILATTFVGDNIDLTELFLVVGTGTDHSHEEEAKDGRLRTYRLADGKCMLCAQREVNVLVHSLCGLKGMLVLTVGPQVQLLSVSARKDGMMEIQDEDRYQDHALAYRLSVKDHIILNGDLHRSVTTLTFERNEDVVRMQQPAKDYDMGWVTAMQMLDDEMCIETEQAKHLYIFQRRGQANSDGIRSGLNWKRLDTFIWDRG